MDGGERGERGGVVGDGRGDRGTHSSSSSLSWLDRKPPTMQHFPRSMLTLLFDIQNITIMSPNKACGTDEPLAPPLSTTHPSSNPSFLIVVPCSASFLLSDNEKSSFTILQSCPPQGTSPIQTMSPPPTPPSYQSLPQALTSGNRPLLRVIHVV